MTLVFQKEPKATHFGATLLHPLKRAEDFYRFHKQSTSGLRPVQPHISDKSEPSPCVSYGSHFRWHSHCHLKLSAGCGTRMRKCASVRVCAVLESKNLAGLVLTTRCLRHTNHICIRYQMASADLRQSCVHNPQRQKAVTGVALPECKSCDREEPSVSPTVACVDSLPNGTGSRLSESHAFPTCTTLRCCR